MWIPPKHTKGGADPFSKGEIERERQKEMQRNTGMRMIEIVGICLILYVDPTKTHKGGGRPVYRKRCK